MEQRIAAGSPARLHSFSPDTASFMKRVSSRSAQTDRQTDRQVHVKPGVVGTSLESLERGVSVFVRDDVS